MPLPADVPPARGDICIFGDSHIGSVKQAIDNRLIDTGGRSVTFWGADGPSFRALRWKNGRVVPDASVLDLVRKINGGSHDTLGPQDFDLFIFYGARLRAHEFFASILEHPGQISAAAMQTILAGWTHKTRAWRIAQAFARAGAQVLFVPASFPTQNVLDQKAEKKRLAIRSSKAQRTALWQHLEDAAARAGFTLVPQLEKTVTGNTLTKAEYAQPNAQAASDWVHKSPQYAALMIEHALAINADRLQLAAE